MIGTDFDTIDSIRADVDFTINNGLQEALFFIFTDYQAISGNKDGLIPPSRVFLEQWDYFNGLFVGHFPLKIKPSILQKELINAYEKFYSAKRIMRCITRYDFATAKYRSFYRLTFNRIRKQLPKYITFLEEKEEGMYDSNDILISTKLRQRRAAYKTCMENAKTHRNSQYGNQDIVKGNYSV